MRPPIATSRFAHLCRSRPRGSILTPTPSFYLDHSHCLVLAPATLAALPSTRAIETRSLPTSLAAAHRGFAFYVASPKLHSLDRDVFYVAHPIHSIVSRSLQLGSTATLAALPAMSLTPLAPLYLARSRSARPHTLAALPAMSLTPLAPFSFTA